MERNHIFSINYHQRVKKKGESSSAKSETTEYQNRNIEGKYINNIYKNLKYHIWLNKKHNIYILKL